LILKRTLAVVATAGSLLLAACGSGDNGTTPTTPDDGQLVIEDLVVGTGATAANGNTLNVHYVGSFTNGTVFDQGNYSFPLGAGQVIRGWDLGLVGMKVAGKRKLTIPPSLAYGTSGRGVIPPNATLVFVVDLLSLQ
jgi:FKBP-type peptidyl-prolyl cis-trans isomerase